MFDKNTPLGKAVRTAYQAIAGLLVAVWAVPGVPEVVAEHTLSAVVVVALAVGIPAGVIALVQNHYGK